MELYEIVTEYLTSVKYSLKRTTYLHYSSLNDAYIKRRFGFGSGLPTAERLNAALMGLSKTHSASLASSVKGLINRALAHADKKAPTELNADVKIRNAPCRKVDCLSGAEQDKLERYILGKKAAYSYGILISMYTGLRLGELIAMRWEDVDFDARIIKVNRTVSKRPVDHKLVAIESAPKTVSSVRIIPLSHELVAILKALKKLGSRYVISNRFGEKVDNRTYQASFRNLLKRLGIKHYGFHALRHTFATRLLESGVDVKTISELLGHANATVTLNRYVHTSLDSKFRAVSALTKKRGIFAPQ